MPSVDVEFKVEPTQSKAKNENEQTNKTKEEKTSNVHSYFYQNMLGAHTQIKLTVSRPERARARTLALAVGIV